MKLNLSCPINTLSYGYVSSFFIKELIKLDYDLRVLPIGHATPDKDIASILNEVLSRQDFFYDSPCLKIWHQHDLHTFTGKGKLIGFPIFELEEFTDIQKHSCKYPDAMIACSEWGRDVLVNNGIPQDRVSVVPLGYDESLFKPSPMPSNEQTVFGNFGKFEVRKGHDVLVKAFNKAFEVDDNVKLVMMPSNCFLSQNETRDWVNLYLGSKLASKIQLIDRLETQEMAYNVMRGVHCGVFPARAEGWNLEALELLACGRHLIITNCTGHTEFCNKENSRLIQMDSGIETAFDGKFFDGSGSWRAIGDNEIDQMVEHMRDIHKLNQEGSLQLNSIGVESVQRFSWPNATATLDEKLRTIIRG
jgi:glycosyltransferase involved in cell wall biosynthesis